VPKVLAFKPNPRKPEQGFVRLAEMIDIEVVGGGKTQAEGEIIEAWTPEIAKAAELVGKELPDGWTLRDGPKGKQLLPPKDQRGGGGSYRNTKEAFDAEQTSIHASVALQQAVELHAALGNGWNGVETTANMMFAWLRKSVSGSEPTSLREAHIGVGRPQESDTISGGEQTGSAPHSTEETSPDERREGDAGDNAASGGDTPGDGAVTPRDDAVQTPGSPSRRRCLHTEGIKTITRETGGAVDVCIQCGMVVVA
jgi:hypothetical protein